MNPDDLKGAWQAQPPGRLTIDAEVLFREFRRNQRRFDAAIFWRDVREVGVAIGLLPAWLFLGAKFHLPLTWYLMVPGLVWIAAFMVVDRMRNKPHQTGPAETLRQCVENSLAEVQHQIWLLRNVLWWYVLPVALPMAAFLCENAWQLRGGGWWAVLVVGQGIAVATATCVGVYWLNQRAVRCELVPRQRELEELLANLSEEFSAGGG